MISDPWSGKLSEYLDGELADAERIALERHLAACPECTGTLADLTLVARRARTLADQAPVADLWQGISARIAAAELSAHRPRPIPARSRTFSLPQLATAAVAAALASGGAVWWATARWSPTGSAPQTVEAPRPPGVRPALSSADRDYEAAVSDLNRVLAAGRRTLDTATVRVLERNLAVIDRAIADARRALAADPNNAYLNAHLARTMHQKIDLLRQAATLASTQS